MLFKEYSSNRKWRRRLGNCYMTKDSLHKSEVASQMHLLLLWSKFYLLCWSLSPELINAAKDGNFASHSSLGQSSAQVGLAFSLLSHQEPQLKHQGMAFINKSIRSYHRGPCEHWCLLCYKYSYVIHSALKPSTWFSMQITPFTCPHKWSGKIEQAKNKGHILRTGIMENTTPWVCKPNKPEGAQSR